MVAAGLGRPGPREGRGRQVTRVLGEHEGRSRERRFSVVLAVVREEVGTGMALGTAGEGEEAVAVVGAEEVGVVELGQAVGTLPGLRLVKGGPAGGWGTFPSGLASAHWGTVVGSWGLVRVGAVAVEEGAETLLRSSAGQEVVSGEEG